MLFFTFHIFVIILHFYIVTLYNRFLGRQLYFFCNSIFSLYPLLSIQFFCKISFLCIHIVPYTMGFGDPFFYFLYFPFSGNDFFQLFDFQLFDYSLYLSPYFELSDNSLFFFFCLQLFCKSFLFLLCFPFSRKPCLFSFLYLHANMQAFIIQGILFI